ncbi:hypothetical protein N0V82_005102 [Gnomoniopsis sp. IMI 355080]|nr:hypothetical protein N0V82_005102 [Gnomoniopsis sp. IMI 355080]
MPHWVRKLFSRKANADCTTEIPREAETSAPISFPPPPYRESILPAITERTGDIHTLHKKLTRAKTAERRAKARRAKKKDKKVVVGFAIEKAERALERYQRARQYEDELQEELVSAGREVNRLWVLLQDSARAMREEADYLFALVEPDEPDEGCSSIVAISDSNS